MLKDKALDIVNQELSKAINRFPAMRSPHEAYAIILEEMDELWDAIKKNDFIHAREEAKQVAAMAVRYLMDVPQ